MKKLIIAAAALTAFGAAAFDKIPGGITTTTADNATVSVVFYTPDIVRVTKAPGDNALAHESLSVTAAPADIKVKATDDNGTVGISAGALKVTVSPEGVVTFADAKGRTLLSEKDAASFTAITDAGRPAYRVSQRFALDADEPIYGLGILQNGKMNQRGERRDLCPGNTEDGIPFFQSAKGYGIYWDNTSTTNFDDTADATTFTSVTGDGVDYYFINGGSADGVIAGVRQLTGDVPMAPLWTYGFHQSRERYKSQEEIVDVLHRYRNAGIPIDCMIQDWQYWGNNYLWNAMEFMSDAFPDPEAMLAEIHGHDAHCLISIWSSFGPMTKPYRQLDEKGLLFDMETWPQSGISHIWPPRTDYPSGVRVYDCYSPEARDIYWQNLRRLYDLGLDGWWMDSTEPDHFNWTEADFDHQTGLGSYRSVRSAFPLMTVGGVYDHQRATSDSTRVFILTRSGAFGQQRYGANVWSGDVVSTWDMLRRQVPAGLNFSLTGNPNFNSDLGGFFAGSYNGAWQGKPAYLNPAYRELYTRWMQQGVFTPMMRSHGADVPRELYYYGEAGEPVYDALVDAVKLRYRLLPYIYSTAREVSDKRGTFMRALVMDFPADTAAIGRGDEYMFGRGILATPILKANYTPEVVRHDADANAGWDKNVGKTNLNDMAAVDFTATRDHTVYLPAGTDWYYFPTAERYQGGREVTLSTDISTIPFFAKAGAILPLGPEVQYTSEKPWDNLDIYVYAGADGDFTLYEDEGDSYRYEQGAFTEIPIRWSDKKRTLTIGARRGSYPGMLADRAVTVTVHGLGQPVTKTISYSGRQLTLKF